MKRMKVFIIALISILLIVTFGRISMAEEPTEIISINKNGSVNITFNNLKYKYENVLCVSKSIAVKHKKHGDNENVEYIIQGSAEIDGNDIILTKYNWVDNYTKITGTVTERFVTENGEGNILATILTTANFSNGYSGGYAYENDDNGNEMLVEESARYGPRQLCTWGFWNTFTASLPKSSSSTGVNWQSLFTPEGNKNNPDQWSTSESNLTYVCDKNNGKGGCGNFAYVNFAEKDKAGYFSTLPDDWVCPKCGSSKNAFTKKTQQDMFKADMKEIKTLAAAHTYRVKVNFVQHVCEDGGLRQKTAQSLIVYEKQPPQIEIVIEKEWKEENASLINNRPQKITALIETYQSLDNKKDEIYNSIKNGDDVDRVYIEGEDKIVELTENNNWKSRLRLKAGTDQFGTDKKYRGEINRRYRVKEVFEIKEGQECQISYKEYPGCKTEDISFENIIEENVVVAKKVKIKGNEEFTIKREAYTFPKVEIIDEILYVEGKKVVESAYVDGIKVADIVTVNGYKVSLDENGRYTEPATDEEIANRKDSVIKNKEYAVVKEKNYVGDTSYIYEDGKMIAVPSSKSEYGVEDSSVGTEAYDEYVEARFDKDPEIEMTTQNAYVRFTNKLEVVNIPVNKVWSPTIDELIKKGFPEPKSVTIQLLANGKVIEGKTITLNKSNNWTGTFANLKKYDNEMKEIKYTVQEGEIIYGTDKKQDLYFDSKVSYDTQTGYTILNKLELINIPVKKAWNCSNKDKIPESVTIQLLANGKIVEGKTITLSASNSWKGTFIDLVKYDSNGNEIKYTIQEIEVPGFATEITGDAINGYTVTNTYYDGYYEIKGTVWLDGRPGKDSTINGILGAEDTGIPGVKVTLMYGDNPFYSDEKGHALSGTTTDKNGEYTIKVNYDNTSTKVYKLYEPASKVETKLSDGNAWIKFEYDGMVYTTVGFDAEKENASKAREDAKARENMDGTYFKVDTSTPEIEYYNEEIDVDGTKKTLPAIDYKDNSYWNNVNITASTKGIIKSFTDYKFQNTHKEKETIKYCNGDTNGDGIEEYISSVPTDTGYKIVQGQHDCANCISGGHIIREVDVDVITINGVNLGLMEREKPDTLLDSTIHKVDVKVKEQNHTYIYNEMNPHEPNKLGKLYQDQEEAIYVRQINSANIVLANKNSQEMVDVFVTYSIGIGKQMETLTTVVNSVINDYDKGYTIDNIKIETLNEENEPDTSLTRNIELSSIEIDDMGTHNRIKLDNLNMRTEGKGYINSKQVLLITYKVKPEVILSLINGDKVLNHATEIDSYETFYGKDTLHAERHNTEQESNRFGKPYAGYDIDSHPGNAEIKLIDGQLKSTDNLVTVVNPETGVAKEQPEDDTDIAPPFKLEPGQYTIAGTVWEDKDEGEETGPDNYRLGNGIKDEGENTLANVKVTLMEVLEDGTKQNVKLYHGLSGISEEGIDAEVYTDKNGNYSFVTPIGSSDEFAGKYSLPAGHKYELKFTYGNEDNANATTTALGENTSIENNGARSARNYKSTIINNANTTVYNYFKNEASNVNDKWHLYTSDNYSIAIDNMAERLNVDEDLYYGNFDEGKNISADSKPFIMTIEFTPDNETKVDADGKTITGTEQKLESTLDIFDFGIIERAREDLVVSKTINYMDVKLVDGSSLANGDPSNKEELNFVKAQGLRNTEISTSGNAALTRKSIRQAMLEMDSEITQGSTVNLQYKIIVTNNSEKDIDYEKDGGNYYKFGIIPANPDNYIMSSSVNKLVTYVNKDLVLPTEENQKFTDDWDTTYIADTLKDATTGETWISENTKKAVKDNNYVVLVTEKFAEVKPKNSVEVETITVNKRLTFKEDNAYDIHSEILVTDGKVARTINSVENGKQIPKTYKSGNFVPSLEKRTVQNAEGLVTVNNVEILSQYAEAAGVHEQDDDTVKVTVTQPTGITKYITTYVIATLIGLVVIVIGIVFIKKKVLTK